MDHMTCFLPGGYVDDGGILHREAELAPLSGREEELLAETKQISASAVPPEVERVSLAPKRGQVSVQLIGLAWMPDRG